MPLVPCVSKTGFTALPHIEVGNSRIGFIILKFCPSLVAEKVDA